VAARAFIDVEIVEHPDPCGAHRGEHRIELGEAGGAAIELGEQDRGFAALQAFVQEVASALQIAGLSVEAAVGVEQERDCVQVVCRGAADGDGHVSSRASNGTAS
jgi:hypothetical protein